MVPFETRARRLYLGFRFAFAVAAVLCGKRSSLLSPPLHCICMQRCSAVLWQLSFCWAVDEKSQACPHDAWGGDDTTRPSIHHRRKCQTLPLPACSQGPAASFYCVLALCACHFRESDTAFRPLLLANRPSLLLPLHAIADFRLAPHDLLALLSWAFSFNPDGTFAAL